MNIIGERWAVPVMRELMLGPRRFSELRAGLPDISANVLTQRLNGLEAHGVLRRRKLPPPASVQVYELTDWGYEAGPVFQMLGRWAARSPGHDRTAPFSPVALMLSIRAMGRPRQDERAQVLFSMGEENYLATLDEGGIAVKRTESDVAADLVVTGEPSAIAAWLYGGAPAPSLEGDRTLADRFPGFFTLPDPVEQPG